MSFIGIMGVGMAMNLLGGLFRPKAPAINPAYMNNMRQTMADHSKEMDKMWEKPTNKRVAFDFDVPDFPDSTAQKFEQMATKHANERTAFLSDFQKQKDSVKDDFYNHNHLKTQKGADGKERVALGQDGKPIVEKGGENQNQKVARQEFETHQKTEMFTKHAVEKQNFVNEQKQQLLTFLDGNKFQLHNPGVQGEMQKLIADGQKKALKLQDKHEEEFYKVDMPEEKVAFVDEKLAQYRDMKEKHHEIEENSKEARELANYQQDLVALLDAKRAEAREQKQSEMFLRDPRKMFNSPPPKEDLASVLPMNMVVALENFGITQLPG